jgi:hypothetical protein
MEMKKLKMDNNKMMYVMKETREQKSSCNIQIMEQKEDE